MEVVVLFVHLSVTLRKPVLPDVGVMLPFTLIICVSHDSYVHLIKSSRTYSPEISVSRV